MVMELHTYSELLGQPELLKNEHISELKSIIKEYPYFQSARALYLKGLKNQDSFRYNNELKVTAAYTSDRSVLFDFITSEKFEETQEDIHQQISQKILEEEPIVVPESVPEIPNEILNPENTWSDPIAYEKQAKELAALFMENFKKFYTAPPEIPLLSVLPCWFYCRRVLS